MGKVTKVVIDTNIFVSGFGWSGKSRELLTLVENKQIINFTSPDIFEELKRVVSYPRLKFPPKLQSEILEFVFFYSEFVEPKKTISLIEKDTDDNRFLECAVEAKADFIISGDPHLLEINEYRGIKLLTVAEFLQIS